MAVAQITSRAPFHYRDLHLNLDFKGKVVALDSRPLVLAPKEYELFSLLVENAGMIVPRQVLLRRVWGYRSKTQTLDVHIYRLRKALGPYAKNYIENIFRRGYRFQPITQPRRAVQCVIPHGSVVIFPRKQ